MNLRFRKTKEGKYFLQQFIPALNGLNKIGNTFGTYSDVPVVKEQKEKITGLRCDGCDNYVSNCTCNKEEKLDEPVSPTNMPVYGGYCPQCVQGVQLPHVSANCKGEKVICPHIVYKWSRSTQKMRYFLKKLKK